MLDSDHKNNTANKGFSEFQRLCLSILAESNNCAESQEMFRSATSIPELATAFLRYMGGLIHEVPGQVLDAFTRLYDEYGPEIRLAGIYFNECPENTSGVVILTGNLTEPLNVYGRARVYILGSGVVNLYDSARATCVTSDAVVNLYGRSNAIMEDGICNAYDFSSFSSSGGSHETHDSAIAHASGGTVTSYGHGFINAYNHAVIKSFTTKRIALYDNARLYRNK